MWTIRRFENKSSRFLSFVIKRLVKQNLIKKIKKKCQELIKSKLSIYFSIEISFSYALNAKLMIDKRFKKINKNEKKIKINNF